MPNNEKLEFEIMRNKPILDSLKGDKTRRNEKLKELADNNDKFINHNLKYDKWGDVFNESYVKLDYCVIVELLHILESNKTQYALRNTLKALRGNGDSSIIKTVIENYSKLDEKSQKFAFIALGYTKSSLCIPFYAINLRKGDFDNIIFSAFKLIDKNSAYIELYKCFYNINDSIRMNALLLLCLSGKVLSIKIDGSTDDFTSLAKLNDVYMLPALENIFIQGNEHIKAAILSGIHGWSDIRVFDFICRHINDKDCNDILIINTIGSLNLTQATDKLIELLSSTNVKIKCAAVTQLAERKDISASDEILNLFKHNQWKNDEFSITAAIALSKLNKKEIIPYLMTYMSSSLPERRICAAKCMYLFGEPKWRNIIEGNCYDIIRLIKDNDNRIDKDLSKLVYYGKSSKAQIVEVIRALAKIKNDYVKDILKKILVHPIPDFRIEAAKSLKKISRLNYTKLIKGNKEDFITLARLGYICNLDEYKHKLKTSKFSDRKEAAIFLIKIIEASKNHNLIDERSRCMIQAPHKDTTSRRHMDELDFEQLHDDLYQSYHEDNGGIGIKLNF